MMDTSQAMEHGWRRAWAYTTKQRHERRVRAEGSRRLSGARCPAGIIARDGRIGPSA